MWHSISTVFRGMCILSSISDAHFHKRACAYRLWCKLSENSLFFVSVDGLLAVLYSHDEDIRACRDCGGSQLDYSANKYRAECCVYLWCIWHREHECEGSGNCHAHIKSAGAYAFNHIFLQTGIYQA